MKSFRLILRNYKSTKTGQVFTKLTAKGKYIPCAECQLEETYTIKFVSSSSIKLPTKEGFYMLAVEDCWVDSRPEYIEKHILRAKPIRIVFEKDLPQSDRILEKQ